VIEWFWLIGFFAISYKLISSFVIVDTEVKVAFADFTEEKGVWN